MLSIYVKQSNSVTKLSALNLCGSLTLIYKSSTMLRGDEIIGKQYAGMSVIASMLAVAGTPYLQTYSVITQNVSNEGSVVIEARGTNYVVGHALEVAYIVLPRTL